MGLYRLVYISHPSVVVTTEIIGRILRVSRTNNARDGITGVLLYATDFFVQLLEGAPEQVEACYARIERDSVHDVAMKLSVAGVPQRSFPDWSMGYAESGEDGRIFIHDYLQRVATQPDDPTGELVVAFLKALAMHRPLAGQALATRPRDGLAS